MALVSHFYLNYGSCCSFLCFCSFHLINWLFLMVQPFFVNALLGFSLRGGKSELMRNAHTNPETNTVSDAPKGISYRAAQESRRALLGCSPLQI